MAAALDPLVDDLGDVPDSYLPTSAGAPPWMRP
jgi:hypothetical protein